MRATVGAATALALVLAGNLRAAERVDYLKEVKPILAARCFACHGALQQKAELRLDTAAAMRTGGDSGPAVVPGKSGESLLIERVTAPKSRRMPPLSEGEGLKPEQIARIRVWIDQGAVGPAGEKPEPDPKEHWAFRPPVKAPVPAVKDPAWRRNPIDAFIATEHERHGLKPQPPIDRRLLLRRVYLDLIGLPPTREELAAFVADSSPDAYEKVVDRLLASPQYGERWGRHWMDVWRYSDWWGLGAEVRNSQKHIWRWRDWVIESLNADKGYDQMVREMLAADELYPNDLDRLRATGYLVRPYFLFNRNSWMEEMIEHTAKGFMGITMNCSRCHDHKYDPIAQVDYYRFRAFFEPYQVRMDQLPGETNYDKDGLPRAFDCNLETPTYLFVRGNEKHPRKDRPLTPGLPPIFSFEELKIRPVNLPAEAHSPGLRPFVVENYLGEVQRQIAAARQGLEQAKKALAQADLNKPATVTAPKPPPKPAEVQPLVKDNFAAAKPDVWEFVSGEWKHAGGKLIQQKDGDERGILRLKQSPPADFEASPQFVITGGRMWKSVGLTFDGVGEDEVLVYLSAYAGGPKVQIAYKRGGGGYVYPPEASRPQPIKLNEPQELTVRVRGPVLNVAVNGKHALAYRLPFARRAGRMELITFDARAAFTGFQLAALPAGVELIDPNPPNRPPTVEQARAAVALAEKTLAAAELQPGLLKARVAADRARLAQPPATDAKELARAAAKVERQAAVVKAEEDLARAELEWLRAATAQKVAVEQKRTAARTALDQACKALATPGETYTSLRGSQKTPENNTESQVSRDKPFPTTSTGRRSALVHWLTDARHPLTARVAVNHVWARHFGKPLVATVFDFGRKGAPPTHPALLDYLAVALRENRWSMKHLHRLMVTSQTYRLASASAKPQAELDGENRWYWRMNPVRMESQIVRDSLLHMAGELDLTRGGPPIPVAAETSRRRSLYFVHSHNDHQKFLSMFDDASVLECYRRAESIVPQQALALENSKLALSAAGRIAARLDARLGKASDAEFVRAAFETVLASQPNVAEQAECERALKELTDVLSKQKQPDANRRARVTLVHALLNHNDFITIR